MKDDAINGATPPPQKPEVPVEPRTPPPPAEEFGGRGGLEPTRYGDWEKDGRCIDF